MYEEDGVESSGSIVEETTTTSQVENNPVSAKDTASEKTEKHVDEGTDTARKTADSGKSRTIPYDRFTEVIKERDELRQKALLLDKLQSDPSFAQGYIQNLKPTEEVDPVIAEADRKIRELGYVRADDVQTMIEQKIAEKEFIREFGAKIQSLEQKYNGSDGLPKFEPEEVVTFMDQYGVKDPEMAYELKFKEELADARAKMKRGSAYSEKPGQPMQTTDDNEDARLIKEAKATNDWTSYFKKKV